MKSLLWEKAEQLGLKVSNESIQPGDKYIAERNTGPKILTCESVHERGWIVPVENAYPYDTWECLKIVE